MDFVGAGHEGEIQPAFTQHDLGFARRAFGDVQANARMLGVEMLEQTVEEATRREGMDPDA